MSNRLRSAAVAGVVTLTALTGAVSTAQATSYVYFDTNAGYGYLQAGGYWSVLVPLTVSHGRSYHGKTVCVAALDSNYYQVGQVSCSSTDVQKAYNGSWRMAFGRATAGDQLSAKLRAEY